MSWIKKNILFLVLPLVYLPCLTNFFSGDDWYHLLISQANNFSDFSHFFSFVRPYQEATFYRPISNQLFFFTFQKLFGLNPLPSYLFGLVIFGISLKLIYDLASILKVHKLFPAISTIIYALSVSNFARLYFLSAFQEIFLVIFVVLAIKAYLNKNPILSVVFYILALLSKETAVVLPVLIILIDWVNKNVSFKKYIPYFAVMVTYLFFRFYILQLPQETAYTWDFSPSKMANTFMWYTFWSLGAPELLIDYVSSGLKIIPRFFIDYPVWWSIIIVPLLSLIAFLGYLFIIKIKKIDRVLIFSALFFTIALSPMLLLPQHKFALEQGLPLVGFAFGVSWLVISKNKFLLSFFLLLYAVYNISMNYLTFTRNYTVTRSKISREVYQYFSKNYPQKPQDSIFVFKLDLAAQNPEWESQKQLSYALSSSDFFKVFYKDRSVKVYYEGVDTDIPQDKKSIIISSQQFFK